jgi:hypothetical protein
LAKAYRKFLYNVPEFTIFGFRNVVDNVDLKFKTRIDIPQIVFNDIFIATAKGIFDFDIQQNDAWF